MGIGSTSLRLATRLTLHCQTIRIDLQPGAVLRDSENERGQRLGSARPCHQQQQQQRHTGMRSMGITELARLSAQAHDLCQSMKPRRMQ